VIIDEMPSRSSPEFRVLGPLEVARDGRQVALGGERQRVLLAVLVLNANRLVPTQRLVNLLFGEDAPQTATQAVRVAVSRLRRSLGDPDASELVRTRAAGYELCVDPLAIDLGRFEQRVAVARARLRDEPEAAAREFAAALALWRGAALADVAHVEAMMPEVRRLEELRQAALSERIDADLATGREAEVIADLEGLVTAEPYRERYRAQLMLALYRSGRQSEALEVYAATRRVLRDELGLEPGPELQELQQAVLRHEETLARPASAVVASTRGGGRLLVAVTTVVLAAVLAVTGFLIASRSAGAPPPLVRPARILATITIPNPGCCSVTHDAVWAAGHHDRLLYKIDPATNKIVMTWPVAGFEAGVPDADAGAVWVPSAAGGLVRFDPLAGRATAQIRDQASAISYAYLAMWQTSREHQLLRLDLRTNRVRTMLQYAPGGNDWDDGIAFAAGDVWIGVGYTGQLIRVDPRTGRIVKRIFLGSTYSELVPAYDGGSIWAFRFVGGQQVLFRIDPATNRIVARIPVGPPGGAPPNGGIGVGAGFVWTCDWDGKISKIDEQTNRVVARYSLPSVAEFVTYGDGSLWASAYDASRVYRIDPRS